MTEWQFENLIMELKKIGNSLERLYNISNNKEEKTNECDKGTNQGTGRKVRAVNKPAGTKKV